MQLKIQAKNSILDLEAQITSKGYLRCSFFIACSSIYLSREEQRDLAHWWAGEKSHSTAYAGLSIEQFSSPGKVLSKGNRSLSGKPVESPYKI